MEVTKLSQPGELFRDCDALPLKKKKITLSLSSFQLDRATVILKKCY